MGSPTASAPPLGAAGPLTPRSERQEERRRRILRSVVLLASRGGFDAVQMREIAELSGVALGTLYRYFPSKVHLLVATMQDQLQLMLDHLRRHPPAAAEPGARVAETLMRGFHVLQSEPQLAEAMVRSLSFADRSLCAELDEVTRLTIRIITDAMGVPQPLSQRQLAAVRVIAHTWHATLIHWLSGRASITEVRSDLETACGLLRLEDERS
jgi:AcrR family transcriptional regulator